MISESSPRQAKAESTEELDLACYNASYVEQLLQKYLDDRNGVPENWRDFFDQQAAENGISADELGSRAPSFQPRSIFRESGGDSGAPVTSVGGNVKLQKVQYGADQLVNGYRSRGHYNAKLDPLKLNMQLRTPLSLESFGLSKSDLSERVYYTCGDKIEQIPLRELVQRLDGLYCNHIGYQFTHIDEQDVQQWLVDRIERQSHIKELPNAVQKQILQRLTEATVFEEFVRKKYVGAKTFSLFGSEMLIPLLDLLVDRAASNNVREVVLGMPHRGRLNVLTNIIGQAPRELFAQFNDVDFHQFIGGGDVKYHLGNSVDKVTTSGNEVHLSLSFNPSHLEFINTVVLGRLRAKQDRTGDINRRKGMAVLIHGDAAFIGEGIVQETLNLSQLDGYKVGGTVHLIVNNQIGFTTSVDQSRSTRYCTDIARMLQIPIFHVNGDDPEAVADVVSMAMDFREKFQRDVIIDLVCYRRLGHNEADEPSFTQPMMYKAIDKQTPIRDSYLDRLIEQNRISTEEANQMSDEYQEFLKGEYDIAQEMKERSLRRPEGVWEEFDGGLEPTAEDAEHDPADECPETRIPVDRSAEILRMLATVPEDFHRNRKLSRIADQRKEMANGERMLDWSSAEALAFATLSMEGHRIRLSGQDCQRGTFNQRHSVLHDIIDGHEHSIFSNLSPKQAPVEIVNSPLSEAGVLGFDYGYSLDYPNALVAWEAQFGDFSNAAQVIIDQFMASAEDKWRRLSGLVLLLPHGYEGQGPEHSSARLERFLWLAAEDNIQVAIPTTPAQYFHVLRRQMKRSWKKPLILFTPKSLLRHPSAVSSLEELASNKFERIIKDTRDNPEKTSRVIMCSGKVYYDLAHYREEHQRHDVAIIRVEQPYPLKNHTVQAVLDQYDDGVPLYWVQEEPDNMGVWPYWKLRYGHRMFERFPLSVIARETSSSPATGSKAAHEFEQQQLLERAFNET
ncbi:2-oxoglutarate dehydrogenase E1 component [Bremerella sp. P1]|uniref:2-oxoglutarate dehydrogenase E1 component n=1 Tax=Bremerella sp. P1 TaxID=3026424 RepID=UPI00236743EF|nr:2-oxoglutarate dehydrogenase E1 component [Bremerella sp. P1]WDI41801.1 2-oxoglutarate dehydrogenase E1 component [Bremerella sp. P1]